MTVTNGYATLAELKAFAGIASTDAGDDAVLEDLIEAASRLIDRETGRTFYARTETRYYSLPDGSRELRLDDDLLTVTTLTNGDGVALASTEYYLWPRNVSPKVSIVLKESSAYYWDFASAGDSEYVIVVAGTWGWAASAPDDIKTACLLIAESLNLRRRGENLSAVSTITDAGVVITPQDVPSAARQIFTKYRRRY